VGIGHRIGQAAEDAYRLRQRDRSAREARTEGLLGQRHDVEQESIAIRPLLDLARVVDRKDVRVVEAGRDGDLPQKTGGFASVWLSRHLAGPFGAYAEVFGSNRERPGGPSTRYLHGAITCLVRSWMHFDLHGGLGSEAAGSPRWIGIGVRQRIAR
jgi:hypothetical protein